MGTLEGKVAIVTGGGSGFGEATVFALAKAGAIPVPVDISEARIRQLAVRLHNMGVIAMPHVADISDPEAVRDLVSKVTEAFGRIDAVVNNACVEHTLPIVEMTLEQWDQVLNVNLRSAFLFAKAVMPIMQAQGGGHFVNIASTAATRAWANAAAYHASKWGLIGFTRGLGVEGRPYNIKASVIVPGGMVTHFFDRFEIPPDAANLQPPENVANLVVYILAQPAECVIQEAIVTPLTETSWP